MQQSDVEKREVEELLGTEISEDLFQKAYIFSQEKRSVVMEHWYLVKLTEECARSLAFSWFTMALCKELNNMKREPGICHSSPTLNHIVPVPGI